LGNHNATSLPHKLFELNAVDFHFDASCKKLPKINLNVKVHQQHCIVRAMPNTSVKCDMEESMLL